MDSILDTLLISQVRIKTICLLILVWSMEQSPKQINTSKQQVALITERLKEQLMINYTSIKEENKMKTQILLTDQLTVQLTNQ